MRYILETCLNEDAIKTAINYYYDALYNQALEGPKITPLYDTKYGPANPPSTKPVATDMGTPKAYQLTEYDIDYLDTILRGDSSTAARTIREKLS